MRRLSPLFVLLVLPVLAGCGERKVAKARPLWPELYEVAADDVPAPGQFIRYARPGPKGGGLDVAVTDYVSKEGGRPRVQLVGVVHVADKPYYERLQTVLDRADTVLFEAIKPDGVSMQSWVAEMKPKEPGDFAGFQQELASWFGFQYQLTGIDYGAERYVHADMTVEQFREEGGAELLDDGPLEVGTFDSETLPPAIKSVLEKIRGFGRLLMTEPNPIRSGARRMMAEALGTMDHSDTLAMFPGLGELILDRRNEVVIEKLEEVLPRTQGTIAIFYGAAHNPDLERRIEKLGYGRDSAFWLRAWALRPPLRK